MYEEYLGRKFCLARFSSHVSCFIQLKTFAAFSDDRLDHTEKSTSSRRASPVMYRLLVSDKGEWNITIKLLGSFLLLLLVFISECFLHSSFVIFSFPRKVLVLQFVIGVALVCAPGLEPLFNLLVTGSLYPGSLIRCVLGLIARKYGL